ncbi:synaptotagmin-like protein 4 isoform X2 [Kryptolebias marmoratus]|uniref:synaptotagmin-like protein 4 isoform X2 n=1 Tax=Kryptolebias marmoratus TaxID=37003 RepID=UPI0007F8E73A|nr:synaptotagmin-like protein 4 isoform X2 [Kryptolebias marmoratus]
MPGASESAGSFLQPVDLKKRTGDWFYNQRINRFSAAPGHDLVRVSLKRRTPSKKRETMGEVLLRNEKTLNPFKPVPLPRQKVLPVNTSQSKENSGLVAPKNPFEPKGNVSPKPSHSDTESAENASITSGKTETESGRVTPEEQRDHSSVQSSPSGSRVPSLTVPVQADAVSTDSSSSSTRTAAEVKPADLSLELEVDRLFKKSIKRAPKPTECLSTLDLRDASDASIGSRSRSVPRLDVQEDEDEEEDIDRLVSFHKMTLARSSSSLQSSKSTLGSLTSIYSDSGDFDSVEVSGNVVFSISYDEHTQSLQVLVKECHDLAYGDASRQLSNPYVKCYLLPDKSRQSKKKTSIKKNTVNPVFNETLKYSVSRSQLVSRSVSISVWHHGRLSRNTFLGEVDVPLDFRNLDSPSEDCLRLMGKAGSSVQASAFAQYKGELVISLKYVTPKNTAAENAKGKKAAPEEGRELHVLIKEAKNLVAIKGGTSDSFVKGHLFQTKAKNTKRKTLVVKKNLNPQYNSTLVYKDLSLEELRGASLELTVWDREAMLSNEFLGGVRLSSGKGAAQTGREEVEPDSVGEEISLWQKMMQYPDSWAEGTLPLRCTMGKRTEK